MSEEEFWAFVDLLRGPGPRWFLTGRGRSGLVASMVGMRLMHIGMCCHVVGEPTAPAIGPGDAMIAVSASGTTVTTLHHAEVASRAGARVLSVTRDRDNPLAALSASVLCLPAGPSVQLGGDLFEQTALVVLDSLVNALASEARDAPAQLRARHTNLD